MGNNLNNLPTFYSGQKVVFKLKTITLIGKDRSKVICPKDGEIVTIHSASDKINGHWNIAEYLYQTNGKPQSTHSNNLSPLKAQSFPLMTYSKVLKEVLISNN